MRTLVRRIRTPVSSGATPAPPPAWDRPGLAYRYAAADAKTAVDPLAAVLGDGGYAQGVSAGILTMAGLYRAQDFFPDAGAGAGFGRVVRARPGAGAAAPFAVVLDWYRLDRPHPKAWVLGEAGPRPQPVREYRCRMTSLSVSAGLFAGAPTTHDQAVTAVHAARPELAEALGGAAWPYRAVDYALAERLAAADITAWHLLAEAQTGGRREAARGVVELSAQEIFRAVHRLW